MKRVVLWRYFVLLGALTAKLSILFNNQQTQTISRTLLSILLALVVISTMQAAGQPSTQRPLKAGEDYDLSEDGKTLTRWYAEDLTTLNMNLDATLASVERLGEFCFYMNTTLSEVTLSDHVVEIERGAFNGTGLKKVHISKSVKKIGVVGRSEFFNPFAECLSLTDIEVASNNRYFKVSDGYLMSKDGSTLLAYAMGRKDENLTLPDGVSRIGGHAFAGALFIKEVHLPMSMKQIGRNAFLDVALLKKITLNEGLEQIGFGAFVRTAIEEVDLPATFTFSREDLVYESPFLLCKSLKRIGVSPNQKGLLVGKDGGVYSSDYTVLYAMPAANGLTEYTAPATLRDIAQAAFSSHQTVTRVYVAQAIDYIPLRCFEGCSKLRSVTMATSCPALAYQSFQDCEELQELHCLGRGVVTLQDADALDGVKLGTLTLYVAPEEQGRYADHPTLQNVKVQAETPKYRYIKLKKGERKDLEGVQSSDVIYNLYPEVASSINDNKQIEGGIQGQTSLLSPTGTPLYLIEVTPTVTTAIVEPLMTLEVADEEVVKAYEQKVAGRTEVKREPQFGGMLVTYADANVPGVETKYLVFGDKVASYVSLVFDTEERYKELKCEEFLAERYLSAKGTDIEGETFDGYARLGRFGYELTALSVGDDESQRVPQINYFKIRDLEYKRVTSVHQPSQVAKGVSIRQIGDCVEFSQQGRYHLCLYGLDGSLLVDTELSGSSYTLPKMSQRGLLVAHTETGEVLVTLVIL